MAIILRSRTVEPWQSLDLGDGQEIRIRIEPPTYEALVLARGELSTADAVLRRLDCVTDWSDVLTEAENGATKPVPFSREALRELLRDFPPALNNLLAIVNPYFLRRDKDERKNSDELSVNGTAPTPACSSTDSSGSSAGSAKPLETA